MNLKARLQKIEIRLLPKKLAKPICIVCDDGTEPSVEEQIARFVIEYDGYVPDRIIYIVNDFPPDL